VLSLDEPALLDIMPQLSRKKMITYGLNPQADVQAIDLHHKDNTSTYTVRKHSQELGQVTLAVPGAHNVQNSLAAIAVALELGVPFGKVKKGIEKFSGVYRRWELKGEVDGVSIYDDYAHHPTECRATLSGAKAGWRRRVVCVFQPHLYSRTRDFYEEFGKSFLLSDVLVVTDVYPAREEPIQGVSGELIVNAAKRFGHKDVHYVADKRAVPSTLKTLMKKGDIIITMGAGDIWKFGEEFLSNLKKKT
jgi:UDP-N-acetylmuramate--alanine ligase